MASLNSDNSKSTVKLTDLISIDILQEVQDGFASSVGMAAAITDVSGSFITQKSNFTDFYTKYSGKSYEYVYNTGLTDFSAPIKVNGEIIGTIIGGQVLTSEINESYFRQKAEMLGVNPETYIADLKEVKTVSKEQAENTDKFLRTIAKMLSSMAYNKFTEKQNNVKFSDNTGISDDSTKSIESIAEKCLETLDSMDKKFVELSEIADKCVQEVTAADNAANVIQNIVMNTRILGFNASIEASRAKESGKGFGVIAQEVRSLADTSKISADEIEEKIKNISSFVRTMDESAKEASDFIHKTTNGINEIKSFISE